MYLVVQVQSPAQSYNTLPPFGTAGYDLWGTQEEVCFDQILDMCHEEIHFSSKKAFSWWT